MISLFLELMRRVFEQELTESQFTAIPKFGQGESVLLTGEESLHMFFEPTQAELTLFEGGA